MKHALTFFTALLLTAGASAAEIHVHPGGNLADAVRAARRDRAAVTVHSGTYYLPETLKLTVADSGLTLQAAPGDPVVISGGQKLNLQWSPFKGGIMQAKTPAGLTFDQLFVNGKRQMMARYPNYDPKVLPYGGFSADAFSKERAARWADPAGGYIHAMHVAHWGGYHYRITGKNEKGEVTYEGGWQNNRPMGMHKQHRFVENIFEELDAPGEWFHDAKTGTLYYYPPAGTDLQTASVEVVRLRHLVEFNDAKSVTLRGFVFRHAARTFMDVKEPLLRSDWTIYRGGALLFNRSENCIVADCELDQLGGNGIFVNGHNRRIRIVGCDIHDIGASAVAFVGEPKSVRNPLFDFKLVNTYADLDKTPGPKTDDYPADCVVEDCLIRHVGVIEKQATGVELSMAKGITIRHCSIYDTSRAGINISEGTFGGHVIEFCDVFDTVKETGDHGSFNSWGRDRFWHLKDAPAEELPKIALLDVVKPNVIRNSRWRCDHGWDVDLDDGSSNYEITNNLFLCGGLKLREGFHRRVWNNITVNNTLHPHVWYDGSRDEVMRNIWMGAYRPAGNMTKGKWGEDVDRNLFTTTDADRMKYAAHGCDAHSLVGDPQFVDAMYGDFRVKDGSPALKLGFKNFPMDQFGVTSPRLKAIARTPEIPVLVSATTEHRTAPAVWLGAKVRELEGEEYSAFGVTKEDGGIQLLEVPANSSAARANLRVGDLIQAVNGKSVRTCRDLLEATKDAGGKPVAVTYIRNQARRQTWLYAPDKPGSSKPPMHFGDTTRLGRPFAKDPSVIRFGGRYLLYYSVAPWAKELAPPDAPRGWAIGIAESHDLVNWKKVGEILPEQECEKNGIVNGRIILLDDKLHLFYNTYGNGPKDALCHAWSADGIHFTHNPTNPVWRPTGDWNNGRAIDVDVVEWGDDLIMYYATRDPAGKIQMLHAIAAPRKSGFNHGDWKSLRDGPVLKPELPWEKSCIEAPSVIKRGDTLYLFYGGGYNNDPQQIGCAVSKDGIHFQRLFTDKPLLPNGTPGEWNSSESGHPGMFEDDDGQFYMFYQGNNDQGRTWFLSWVKIGWNGDKPRVIEPHVN